MQVFFEELREKGVKHIKISDVQGLLDSGVDPEDIFDHTAREKEGYQAVKLNDKWNFIDANNKLLSPNQWFDYVDNFRGGFARVKLNGKSNHIGINGKLLSPNQWFDYVDNFRGGFARFELDGKWNYIGKDGKLLSPNQWFDNVGDFRDGFAWVKLNDKWNYVNKEGKLLSPNQWFDWTATFFNGFAMVEIDGKTHMINQHGELKMIEESVVKDKTYNIIDSVIRKRTLKENDDLKNKRYPLPENLKQYLISIKSKYNGRKTVDGWKRLNNLIDTNNGLSFNEMKRLKNYFDNYIGDENDTEFLLNGGKRMRTWVNSTLDRDRQAVYGIKKIKQNMGMSNAFIKPHSKLKK